MQARNALGVVIEMYVLLLAVLQLLPSCSSSAANVALAG
jgi:hypothetical protein